MDEQMATLQNANVAAELLLTCIQASYSGITIADAQQPDMPLIFINETFEQMTGYAVSDVIGKNCRFLQGTDRDQPGLDVLRSAIRNSQPCTVEIRNYRKNGVLFWNELSMSPVFDADGVVTHYIGIQNDITRRKEAEMARQTSEERLHAIVSTAADAIIAIDENGIIQTANLATVTLFGHSLPDLVGQSVSILLPNASSATHAAHMTNDDLRQLVANRREFETQHKDGSHFIVEANFSEMQIHGQQMYTGILRDITERHEYEKMREKFLSALQSSNRDLEDFAYIVAHDLKAPLRAIGSLARWLATDYQAQIDVDGQEIIELLVGRTQRMEGLIDGILRYSRINTERTAFGAVDLKVIMSNLIELLAPPQHIQITVSPNLPTITGDAVQLAQLFQNLLSNAIKFMDKPEGRIEVRSTLQSNEVVIEVCDNGPGIEPQYFEKIFEIFETLQARDDFESTGIGLSIVKKIVNLHQGNIRVESKIGTGTSFFVTLPLQIVEVKAGK